MPVRRRERLAQRIDLARIASRADRRIESLPAQVLQQHEAGESLEHRYFDQLALTGPLAVDDGGQRAIGGVQPGHLVGNQRWQVTRPGIAINARQQRGRARCRLDHVVIGLKVGIGTILPESDAVDIDDIRADLPHRFVIQP